MLIGRIARSVSQKLNLGGDKQRRNMVASISPKNSYATTILTTVSEILPYFWLSYRSLSFAVTELFFSSPKFGNWKYLGITFGYCSWSFAIAEPFVWSSKISNRKFCHIWAQLSFTVLKFEFRSSGTVFLLT